MFSKAVVAAAVMAGVAKAQVTATGTMGTTNPPAATMGTAINQTSYSRLLSLNAIDDFCLFAPGTANQTIGDSEAVEVAWCTQARNNARVIPDGTFTAVHFVKSPLYWQIQGFGDFTRLNIQNGDEGGELDPHGATGLGNPVGGNVTTNATGSDVSYQEWMNYMSATQFCLRICISENSTYSAAEECQHTLDEMGCEWVMPGDYTDDSFTECEADSAYPPGIYPLANGSTSTFAQRYTGTYTAGTSVGTFTVGYTVTPQTPYSTPASSMCTTYSTISNGIALASLGVSGSVSSIVGAAAASTSGSMSGSMSASGSMSMSASSSKATSTSGSAASSAKSTAAAAASSGSASASSSKSGGARSFSGNNYGGVIGGALSVVAVLAGAGVLML